jgi:DHA1 family bicyclomycin/chloramphenicol resistance-like MFS transporter
MGYTIATGLVFGSFFGYINSAQQIFQEFYDLGNLFPIVFGALALSLSIALFLNTRFVRRHGMRLLVRRALLGICSLSTVFFTIALVFGGRPPLWILIIYLATSFFCIGLLFGNLNAIAMQPLGHIAGVGAAVVGFLSTLIAVPIGILIGQCYNESVLPIAGGFTVFCLGSLLISLWVESHDLANTDRRKIQRSLET